MTRLNDIQDAIVEDFGRFRTGMEKYQHIIALGKEHPGMPEQFKTDENSVPGCQSTVWIKSECNGSRVRFLADSDSLITRGIVSLLLRVFNDQPPREVAEVDLYFIDEIGLSSQLSPSRRNGLAVIVREIRKAGKSATPPDRISRSQ